MTLPAPDMSPTPNVDHQNQARMGSDEAQTTIIEKGSRVEVRQIEFEMLTPHMEKIARVS